MGRLRASILAFALGALAAFGLVACGGGDSPDLLPGSTASEITANLDQVKELATEGDCIGAETAAQAVSTQIEALGGVDKTLKQALREGANRLNEVVAECVEAPEEETAPAIEESVEPEVEEAEKPDKDGQPKKGGKAGGPAGETGPALPPQAEGKAKGHEGAEEAAPPAESDGTPSGGIGPGEQVGGE